AAASPLFRTLGLMDAPLSPWLLVESEHAKVPESKMGLGTRLHCGGTHGLILLRLHGRKTKNSNHGRKRRQDSPWDVVGRSAGDFRRSAAHRGQAVVHAQSGRPSGPGGKWTGGQWRARRFGVVPVWGK